MLDKFKTVIGCFAIGGIVALDLMALYLGHDGVLLATSIGAIGAIVGGLAGFEYGLKKN